MYILHSPYKVHMHKYRKQNTRGALFCSYNGKLCSSTSYSRVNVHSIKQNVKAHIHRYIRSFAHSHTHDNSHKCTNISAKSLSHFLSLANLWFFYVGTTLLRFRRFSFQQSPSFVLLLLLLVVVLFRILIQISASKIAPNVKSSTA